MVKNDTGPALWPALVFVRGHPRAVVNEVAGGRGGIGPLVGRVVMPRPHLRLFTPRHESEVWSRDRSPKGLQSALTSSSWRPSSSRPSSWQLSSPWCLLPGIIRTWS